MQNVEIQTQRLRLRKPVWEDAISIHMLHALPETDLYNTLGIPKHPDETKKLLETWITAFQQDEIQSYTLIIEGLVHKDFIGLIALNLGAPKYKRGEVWYKLLPQYWGRGLATESLSALLQFGFNTLQLHRIEAGCAVDNAASARVLEKVGMQKEGRKRKVLPLKSGWSDNYEYGILKEDLG